MKFRTTLILALICAACAAYGYFVVFRRPPTDIDLITPPRVLEIDVSTISRIEVERQGRPVFSCERRGQRWWLTHPIESPAVHEAVEAIALAFAYMHEHGTQQGRPDPARAAEYGLDAPRIVGRIRVREKTYTFEVGGDIGAEKGQYVRLRETGEIHVLGPSFLGALETPLEKMRERRVFVFGNVWASAFTLRAAGEPEVRFERRAGTWWVAKPVEDRADEAALQGAFGALAALTIERFIPRPADGSDPLQPPAIEMIVEFEGESAPARARFGVASKDLPDLIPCSPTLGGDLGLVREADLKPLLRPVREWRSHHIAWTTGEKLRSCAVTVGGNRYVARRTDTNEGSTWKLDGTPVGWIVDPGGAEALANSLAVVIANDLVDAPEGFSKVPYGLDPPAAVLELEFDAPGATSRTQRLEAGYGAQRGLGYIHDPARRAVLVVQPDLVDRLVRGPLNFRSRTLFNLPLSEERVWSVTVRCAADGLDQRAGQKPEGEEWECVVSGSTPAAADQKRLRGIVEDFARFEAQEYIAFGEGPKIDPDAAGGARVTLGIGPQTGPSSTRECVFEIGAPRSDGLAPARMVGDPAVFTVRAGFLEGLRRDFREALSPPSPDDMGPRRK